MQSQASCHPFMPVLLVYCRRMWPKRAPTVHFRLRLETTQFLTTIRRQPDFLCTSAVFASAAETKIILLLSSVESRQAPSYSIRTPLWNPSGPDKEILKEQSHQLSSTWPNHSECYAAYFSCFRCDCSTVAADFSPLLIHFCFCSSGQRSLEQGTDPTECCSRGTVVPGVHF